MDREKILHYNVDVKTKGGKKMKRKLLSRILALTMCATLLLSGCAGSKEKDSSNESGKEGTTTASELRVAISANPPSLDPPAVNSNIVGGIGIHVYESLLQ